MKIDVILGLDSVQHSLHGMLNEPTLVKFDCSILLSGPCCWFFIVMSKVESLLDNEYIYGYSLGKLLNLFFALAIFIEVSLGTFIEPKVALTPSPNDIKFTVINAK